MIFNRIISCESETFSAFLFSACPPALESRKFSKIVEFFFSSNRSCPGYRFTLDYFSINSGSIPDPPERSRAGRQPPDPNQQDFFYTNRGYRFLVNNININRGTNVKGNPRSRGTVDPSASK